MPVPPRRSDSRTPTKQRVSLTKQHIIEVAAELVREGGSVAFRVADLSERASVGIPTIYYHFTSREQVIAEAQLANYFTMTMELPTHFNRASEAIVSRQEPVFHEALRDNLATAWRLGGFDAQVGIMRMLIDIWAVRQTKREFLDMLDGQYARWVAVMTDAQELGWIDSATDAGMLVSFFWAASIGQAAIPNRTGLDVTPETIADFCLRVVGASSDGATRPRLAD